MKKTSFICLLLFLSLPVWAQYKYDNVLFKTVFPQDLCKELAKQTGYILLDVRSPGEYADTSAMGLNLGHLKDAVNINVRELDKRLAEIANYKDRPVFVYCSHSQRSRRASKMLADSGFTNVLNINGGMTAIRQLTADECLQHLVQTKLDYDLISAETLCKKLSAGNNIFVLDVRPDSAYLHKTTDAKINAFGTFANSTHIALTDLASRITELPLNKDIIIIDIFGDDAAKAAQMLKQKKFKKVSVLVEGIDRFLLTDSRTLLCKPGMYISPVPYHIISVPELGIFVQTKKDRLVLDIRSREEFANKHTNYWMNIGHMVNAVNIPVAELNDKSCSIENFKTKPVLLYSFGSGSAVYEAAGILAKKGFTDINILAGGLFDIRWTAANIKGNTALAQLVENVPAERL